MTTHGIPITDHLDLWTSAITSKATAGRGTRDKQTAYGIKKLRELILELAVRGKLVPQDPNDEPACVLLKKVSTEKGEVKKEKSLPDVGEGEMPFQLPPQWEWVRFGYIAQHNSGKTLDRGRNAGNLRDYITTSNLYWGRFDLNNIRQMPIADDEVEKCTAKRGDLLICEGGEAGRAAVWNYDHDACFQNHVHRARFYGDIDPYFAYRFFEKLNATGEIYQHRKGVGISNMSSKALALIVIPLPPLAEQHRIVAKVDELMALCDQLEQQQTDSIAAHQTLVQTLLDTLTQAADAAEFEQAWSRIADHFDTLFTTEPSIDQLKQTLLQLAVMGKLVPQDSNDEPADVLLEKLINKNENVPGKTKQQNGKVMQSIMAEEKSFDLPSSWCWVSLDELSPEYQNGASSRGDKSGKDIIVLRLADIDNWKVSLKNTRTLTITEHSIAKYSLQTNDILIIRVNGSADIVGRFILCEEKYDAIYCDHFIRMRFQHEVLIPSYLVLLGLSDLVRNRINQLFISTAGQKTVNQKHIGSLVVSVPPLAEQHRIVAKVDELMTLCDALKARIAAAQTTQLQLADVIVEQAVT